MDNPLAITPGHFVSIQTGVDAAIASAEPSKDASQPTPGLTHYSVLLAYPDY